jgi:hypothetical protein
LVFEGTVPDLAVTMEKQGAGECVPGLALVEPGVGTASERWIRNPVEDEGLRSWLLLIGFVFCPPMHLPAKNQ